VGGWDGPPQPPNAGEYSSCKRKIFTENRPPPNAHTPAWLNQIELWFGILVRRVIKRGNFASINALCQRLLAFSA